MFDTVPRETLIFSESGEFLKENYPWANSIRITIQGGKGGNASDGTPGELGESTTAEYGFDVSPARVYVVIGKGGRGDTGAQDGEDGMAIVELFE